MKSIFKLKIDDISIEPKFIDRFKSNGFSTFFPPQALGALTLFNLPIIDKIVEFDRKVYSEFQIPFFKIFLDLITIKITKVVHLSKNFS